MKTIFRNRLIFFFLAVVLLWIKTYIIYHIEFDLDISNYIQKVLLFINPISSILVFFGITWFGKGKRFGIYLLLMYAFASFLLYANAVFYRFNDDYLTWPVLTQTENFGSLGASIVDLIAFYDVLYFVDIFLLIFLFLKIKDHWPRKRAHIVLPIAIIFTGIIIFNYNLSEAEKDRPELLERTFDRNYIVKYLGLYNFAIYDAIQNFQLSSQRASASSDDLDNIVNYLDKYTKTPNKELTGVGAGKNIIKIHLESFQSFLINYELHGEEVTPFINSIVNDMQDEFTYFENFFHQTEQGKTADAELIMDTSLFGLPNGSAFVRNSQNVYQPLSAILKQKQGYTSAVLHGDRKSFWNRDEIYKSLAIDEFYHEDYYDMSDHKVINYGLKDKPFFEESIPYLKSLPEPFYAHLITLTHHHPYLIDEEDATIEPAETGDASVDRYFQTARYLDEALEEFFEDLKKNDLYEDSIIMLYGDHYGISNNHNEAMEQLLDIEEMTPFKSAHLQRVPFMIKIPGVEGQGTVDQYTGQIDAMPTLLNIVGIDPLNYVLFGSDMFTEEPKGYVVFRNGDIVTPEFSFIGDIFYDNETEEEIEENAEMANIKKRADRDLLFSDKILTGDLLRFYTPTDDWQPVDPTEYNY